MCVKEKIKEWVALTDRGREETQGLSWFYSAVSPVCLWSIAAVAQHCPEPSCSPPQTYPQPASPGDLLFMGSKYKTRKRGMNTRRAGLAVTTCPDCASHRKPLMGRTPLRCRNCQKAIALCFKELQRAGKKGSRFKIQRRLVLLNPPGIMWHSYLWYVQGEEKENLPLNLSNFSLNIP